MPIPAPFFCLTSLRYIVTNHLNVLKFSAPLDSTSSQNLSYAESFIVSCVNKIWRISQNECHLNLPSLNHLYKQTRSFCCNNQMGQNPCQTKDKLSLFSHSHHDWVSGQDHLRSPGLGCMRNPSHKLSMNTEGGISAELSLANGQSWSLRWFVIQ